MRGSWVAGTVVRGDGRGRTLGFPTANLELEDAVARPADGVYACWVTLGAAGEVQRGALHIGPRPTFLGGAATVEVHILDFPDRDLYGERVLFLPVERLREVKKFPSQEALIAALHNDCEKVRARLG
ncbi:MAG TPA: riboflavin kinase [Candidatus Andersenbacteria bacterium]|nr:riboflavin kinase [Candidatus Andersenbacteria bacterium]